MERQRVQSSSLRSVGYDPEGSVLELEFQNGGVYQYVGVTPRVYDELMAAESKGRYFIDRVRGRYSFTRMGGAEVDDVERWEPHIVPNPQELADRPVVRGTHLSVDFVLGLFAAGWTAERVLTSYPALTPPALRAVFAYAADVIRDGRSARPEVATAGAGGASAEQGARAD